VTTAAGARELVGGLKQMQDHDFSVMALQKIHERI